MSYVQSHLYGKMHTVFVVEIVKERYGERAKDYLKYA